MAKISWSRALKDGIKIEREALNIQEKQPPSIAIQINFTNPQIDEWAS